MTNNTTAPAVLWQTLRYDDCPAAIEFLMKAFGFEERARYAGENDGSIAHAELRWPGGGGVMLGSGDGGELKLPVGVGSTYIVVNSAEEVDELFRRAVAAGATAVREPTDEDYGGRDFVVRDPQGVFWSFGTYAGE